MHSVLKAQKNVLFGHLIYKRHCSAMQTPCSWSSNWAALLVLKTHTQREARRQMQEA